MEGNMSNRLVNSTTSIILLLPILFWTGYRAVADIKFNRGCGGYLKRAADANSVELAKAELTKAIHYIESRGMTTGYTSIVYNTPDEDVGFWYTNLKTSLKDLEDLGPNASPMEKSNTLIKLRETLLDHGNGTEHVTMPSGISVYPNNLGVAVLASFGTLLALISGLIFITTPK